MEFTKEDKVIILENLYNLKRLQHSGSIPHKGICLFLQRNLPITLKSSSVYIVCAPAKGWAKYSGVYAYPVPFKGYSSNLGITDFWGTGVYAENRWELVDFLIKYYEAKPPTLLERFSSWLLGL